MDLKDKVIVITGSSKGIGKEIAFKLASLGAHVLICSRSQGEVDKTVAAINQTYGLATGYSLDLTIEEEVKLFSQKVKEKFGRVDALINNAGGYPKNFYSGSEQQPSNVWDWSYDLWKSTININLNTAFLCTKYFLPTMIEQKDGKIINISSRMGRIASQMGGYAAAKSALIALTKTTAIQAKEFGVIVNAISPTVINTDSQRTYNASVGNEGLEMENANGIVNTVKFLLVDAPSTMTGQSVDLFQTV